MPAFGFSAVPLPIRRKPPTAEALLAGRKVVVGTTGVPLAADPAAAEAAGLTVLRRLAPISERVAAAMVQVIGAAAGLVPLAPAPAGAVTGEAARAAGATAVMTGGLSAAGAGTAADARGADRCAGTDAAGAGPTSEALVRAEPATGEDARDLARVAVCEDRDGPASAVALDPAEPSRSANATGIEAIPAPIPKANASAPTRPTYLA
jgi:hypothetical protein